MDRKEVSPSPSYTLPKISKYKETGHAMTRHTVQIMITRSRSHVSINPTRALKEILLVSSVQRKTEERQDEYDIRDQ